MQDQPVKPIALARYWIEYVIRHKGATHLRSAALDLTWFQREMIDIMLFFMFLLIFIILLVYLLLSLFKKVFKRKNIDYIEMYKKHK